MESGMIKCQTITHIDLDKMDNVKLGIGTKDRLFLELSEYIDIELSHNVSAKYNNEMWHIVGYTIDFGVDDCTMRLELAKKYPIN